MKLLSYMPEVAKYIQYRFKPVLADMLLDSDRQVGEDEFIIFVEHENHRIEWAITESLFTVVCCAREYGKDCQILRLKNGKTYSL